MTPELQSQIAIWRAKCADGTMTLDDYKAAILLMRGERKSASTPSEQARRTKARAAIKSADEMLDELGSI